MTTPDLSSIHTRHKHCGARLTTEQQANQCQQSYLMELWLNEQVIWDALGSTLTECWPTVNMWKQQRWSARKICQSWRLWLQREERTSSYSIKVWCSVSLITDQASQQQTNLLKLDRVQNEAMRVILGTTKDTHWDHEVHAKPSTNANQTESEAGQSII